MADGRQPAAEKETQRPRFWEKKKVIESQTQKMFSSEVKKIYRTKRVEKYFSVPKMASPEARKKNYIVKRAKSPRGHVPRDSGLLT